jgi:hypothetical protein
VRVLIQCRRGMRVHGFGGDRDARLRRGPESTASAEDGTPAGRCSDRYARLAQILVLWRSLTLPLGAPSPAYARASQLRDLSATRPSLVGLRARASIAVAPVGSAHRSGGAQGGAPKFARAPVQEVGRQCAGKPRPRGRDARGAKGRGAPRASVRPLSIRCAIFPLEAACSERRGPWAPPATSAAISASRARRAPTQRAPSLPRYCTRADSDEWRLRGGCR